MVSQNTLRSLERAMRTVAAAIERRAQSPKLGGLLPLRETLWVLTEARAVFEVTKPADEAPDPAPIGFRIEQEDTDADHGQDVEYPREVDAPSARKGRKWRSLVPVNTTTSRSRFRTSRIGR